MLLATQYDFLFVGREEGSFLDNFVYEKIDSGQAKGKIFLCVEIQHNKTDAERIAQAIFEALKRTFFAAHDGKDGYVRFEEALKEANKAIEGFRAENDSGYVGTLHIIAAAIEGDDLYVSQSGEAEAYLVRKRFVSTISDGLYDSSEKETFQSVASGTLEAGDFVLLSSTRLLRYIAKTDLSRLIASNDVIRTLSDLRDAVATEILGKIAFVGVSVFSAEADDQEFDTEIRRSVSRNASGFLAQMKQWKKRFMESLPTPSKVGLLGRFTTRVQERLTKREGMTKDKVLAMLIVVILLLTFGIWFVKNGQERRANRLHFEAVLNEAVEQISDAESKGQYDKASAAAILANAEDKAREVLNSGEYRVKASEILAQIQTSRDTLDDIRHVEPRVFADLAEQNSSINALGFVGQGNRFYVFDATSVYEVLLDKVEEPVVVDENEVLIGATDFDERESVVLISKSGKVYEFKDGVTRQFSTIDGAFRRGVAIDDWSNRIYLLDPEGDQIWRYSYIRSKDIFGNAETYKVDGDVSAGVDIAIDGSVYVLKDDGVINRYYTGTKQDFFINSEPFNDAVEPTKLFTNGDMSFAFVLDSADSRVFVYGKDSSTNNFVYRYQVQLDGLSGVKDLHFAQNTNQLYVLDSKKIYEVTL